MPCLWRCLTIDKYLHSKCLAIMCCPSRSDCRCELMRGVEAHSMTEPGVVFTKDWVVDFVLDIAGYTTDRDLLSGCVVEPSCGDGAFLGRVVSRLCECAADAGVLSAARLVPANRHPRYPSRLRTRLRRSGLEVGRGDLAGDGEHPLRLKLRVEPTFELVCVRL